MPPADLLFDGSVSAPFELGVAGLLEAPAVPVLRTAALLRASHLLRGVPAAVRAAEQLAPHVRVRALRAGELLWREGDRATAFHVICEGLVAVRRTLPAGAEVIVAIFGARETIGDTAAIERACYPADAVVVSESATVLRVDAEAVCRLSARCPELSQSLQQALCRHAAALRTKVEILSAGTVAARLARLFLHLASRFGDQLDDGAVVVPLALSRTALASLVSARTETVIRALRPWERRRVLVTRDGVFVLSDLPFLTQVAARG
jgi:CRP-like cAMP-binding protein